MIGNFGRSGILCLASPCVSIRVHLKKYFPVAPWLTSRSSLKKNSETNISRKDYFFGLTLAILNGLNESRSPVKHDKGDIR